jgi:hypothetical protein
MQAIKRCTQLLRGNSSCAATISSSAVIGAGSSLERFIKGTYDPITERKKQEGDEGGKADSGAVSDRPGRGARRQALGAALARTSQQWNYMTLH